MKKCIGSVSFIERTGKSLCPLYTSHCTGFIPREKQVGLSTKLTFSAASLHAASWGWYSPVPWLESCSVITAIVSAPTG